MRLDREILGDSVRRETGPAHRDIKILIALEFCDGLTWFV